MPLESRAKMVWAEGAGAEGMHASAATLRIPCAPPGTPSVHQPDTCNPQVLITYSWGCGPIPAAPAWMVAWARAEACLLLDL